MENIFVIVECGFEGIERLIFATTDSEVAVSKINELKQNILNAKEKIKKLASDNGKKCMESISMRISGGYSRYSMM